MLLKLCNDFSSASAIHANYICVVFKKIRSNKATLKIVDGSAATILR
jgi:hypothetical protein